MAQDLSIRQRKGFCKNYKNLALFFKPTQLKQIVSGGKLRLSTAEVLLVNEKDISVKEC